MATNVISDLRLVTLLPTDNQTIYAFNTNNPNEYYTTSFFAKIGTTWAFCVVPDRTDNIKDCYVNIVQSDNQTIILNAVISDSLMESELRSGILNYYNSNILDRYTYTIGYQNIRIFVTSVLKEKLNTEYKTITPIQTEHQLILIVDSSDKAYSYGIDLPINSSWKAVLIAEPGYIPGNILIYNDDDEESEPEELPAGEIPIGFIDHNISISATPAIEIYEQAVMKPWLFDNSTIDHSNSDGHLDIAVGTETRKELQTILLYTKNKIDGPSVQIGIDQNNLLYAPTGTSEHSKASRIIYKTASQSRYLLKSIPGYYNFEYILGYSAAIRDSSFTPTEFETEYTRINIKGFAFCSETSPVNDLTVGHWVLIIDRPTTPEWTYIKIMMFDNGRKLFSMIAYKNHFIEVTEGKFVGELMYIQGSKSGINDDAYLFVKDKFLNEETIDIGIYIS